MRAAEYFAQTAWPVDFRCECSAHNGTHVCLTSPDGRAGRCFENVRSLWSRWHSLIDEHHISRLMHDSLMALADLEGLPARSALFEWLATGEPERSTDGMPAALRRWIAPLIHEQFGSDPGWLDEALTLDIRESPRRELLGLLNIALAAKRRNQLSGVLPEAGRMGADRSRL